MNLLKKEFRLCMHPTAPMMLCLSALILVPAYPYAITCFYMTLAIFFTCLTGRENHDAAYTACLPVSRRDMVRGRMGLACILEGVQLLACLGFVFLRPLTGSTENSAGMDANIAVIAEGLIVFGLFNVLFFPRWYKDITKVGPPFIVAGAAVFLYITLSIVSTYAVPFVRDVLDTPDPEHLTEKLIFLACAGALYAALTLISFRLSVRRFEQVDLQL